MTRREALLAGRCQWSGGERDNLSGRAVLDQHVCGEPGTHRGWCAEHYARLGTPSAPVASPADRSKLRPHFREHAR